MIPSPQPTDVWTDDDSGKTYYEYSWNDIAEWMMERQVWGRKGEQSPHHSSVAGQHRMNISFDEI